VRTSALVEPSAKTLMKLNSRHAQLFSRRPAAPIAIVSHWNIAEAGGVVSDDWSRHLPDGCAMTEVDVLQFEVIRTIAASLISVAIILLWLVAITRQ
jgi:hypothetical protein